VPKPSGRRRALFLVLGVLGLVGVSVAAVKFWPKPTPLPTPEPTPFPKPGPDGGKSGTTPPPPVPVPSNEKYVGLWEQPIIARPSVWEFKKDGTVTVTPVQDGKTLSAVSSGKWREENGILKIEFQYQPFTVIRGPREYDGKLNAEGQSLSLTLTRPIGEMDWILLRRKQ
jgi:hypothetical protein